jgi:hypothetical protein
MTARSREDELREVPLWKANKERWPPGVREIAMEEQDCLGIDSSKVDADDTTGFTDSGQLLIGKISGMRASRARRTTACDSRESSKLICKEIALQWSKTGKFDYLSGPNHPAHSIALEFFTDD